ncbi:twin-arginine translocation signal domain-containing protein [Streptomyces sp. NPDC098085]|uniref:twin-arginine translocation signal domain-containing protein n=1 Tax=Streptomyces sp. NPDC098085 TaxID=3366094 RepID=UPI00381C3064
MRRRRFITASAAATVALALGIDETPMTGRLSMSDITHARERIDRLDAHFSAIGGESLLAVATAYLDRLTTAADHCTYGTRVEQALHTAIAVLCSSAGWAADDAGNLDAAHQWRTTALQRAILGAGHRAQARAWSDLATHARRGGHHREALRISQTALASRGARQDPRYAALLQSRLAMGHARTGDHPAAARALLAAQTAHDRINPTEPAPRWLNFLTAAEISGLAAITHQAMGHLADAETATTQALTLLEPGLRRSHAYYSVQLTELQIAQGNTAGARTTVAAIDTTKVSSQNSTGRLATVRRTLATA